MDITTNKAIINGNPYANVPSELKDESRWVAWGHVMRDRRETKVPFDPNTGHQASSTDLTTWGTLDEAIAHKIEAGTDGIGFVLGDGYAGIDFDDFVDPETGEFRAGVENCLKHFGSYAELSPSGRGVHILGYAKKPGEDAKKKFSDGSEIEIYDWGRYFTFTGNHIDGTPKGLRPIQTPLEQLYSELFGEEPKRETKEFKPGPGNDLSDHEVIEKATNAANGERFKRLMTGDTSEYDDDESRADLALIGDLAFWTNGDPEKMDRIFRTSGLMRPKWDSRRGSETYVAYYPQGAERVHRRLQAQRKRPL